MGIGRKVLILLSLCVLKSRAFVSIPRSALSIEACSAMTLTAKKKRRVRKIPSDEAPSTSSDETSFGNDELPDFDLEPIVAQDSPRSTPKSSSSSIDGEAPITNAQMGRVKPMSSLSDLLNDRSLESALPFEEPVDAEPLPSFAEYKGAVKKAPAAPVVGNQKARQEAREAARAAEEEANNGFFSNLPFIGNGGKNTGEKSDISPIKLLENGTWAGIFILVAWEIYINSPLFERAGPMAPIVYDKLPM